MQDHHGVFIVLEGSDGSGKGTQFRLLSERLKAVGHEVAVFDFPRYSEPSSHFVTHYLNGEYGPANEISPYTASIFYALDRYEAAPHIKKALDAGKVVLANRYVGSNMAHQGAKFSSLAEQRGFFMWADSLEYQLLGIPRPSINVVLKVPAEISFELIAKKSARNYTDKKRDEHEASVEHIKKAVAAYELLCKLFPRDFMGIDCVRDGRMFGVVEINNQIWETIKPLLPQPRRKAKSVVLNLDQIVTSLSSEKKPSLTASKLKSPSTPRPSKGSPGFQFEGILNLQKQLLSKLASTNGVNQKQLKTAADLLTPLHYRKSDLRQFLNIKTDEKISASDDPVSVNELINKLEGQIPAPESSNLVKLLAASPRNEFMILDEDKSTSLNYRQKEQALANKLKNSASDASYRFETVTDYGALLAFSSEIDARKINISNHSPRLGYAMPDVIESAGLDQTYRKAFELSAELYKQMTNERPEDATYVLLLGHNVRWKFEVDAAVLANIQRTSKNKELLSFLGLLRDKIAEYHPHVAKILSN